MIRCHTRVLVSVMSITLALSLTQFAAAQRGRGFFGGASRVQLASLEKVQGELKLTDGQKQLAADINQKLSEDRRELFQGGGGDFAAMREKMEKMNAEANAKLVAELDDKQNQRLTEIYVQIAGANALLDPDVGKSLQVSEQQHNDLVAARDENTRAMRGAFQDFQNMSDEERREAGDKLRREGDERLLAVLSDAQKEQFGKLKGEEIELDLSQLFRGRGGRGGN